MGTLEAIRNWTPDKDQGRTDFADLPAATYVRRVAPAMVRTVDATAAERSTAAKAAAALRGPVNTNTDYANPKAPRPLAGRNIDGPSQAQQDLISKLIADLRKMDAATGQAAFDFTAKHRDDFTGGREGTASAWITRLINKAKELRSAQYTPTAPVVATAPAKQAYDKYDDITNGNYAYERDGKTHFYRISRSEGKGQYAGRTFLNIQERASGELFNVRGAWPVRRAILDAIRTAGVEASHVMYAERLGRCWHCNLALTDDDNPYKVHGLGPVCGPKVMG
jgi:hypothetical protein